MLVFGHLGIGYGLARPVARGLRARWILVGTLVPDLIDKPLFYGARAIDVAQGLITGSRTFGHTGLLLLAVAAVAWSARSRALAAIAIGMATHLALDVLSERIISDEPQAILALLWPWFDGRFPVLLARDMGEHLAGQLHPLLIGGELLGLAILVHRFRRKARPA